MLQACIASAVGAVKLVPHRILGVIVLVILLGWIKLGCIDDLGDDRLAKRLVGAQRFFRHLGQRALLFVVGEDRRTVRVAGVAELPVLRRWVDRAPLILEHFE